jgi:hypothetical protein
MSYLIEKGGGYTNRFREISLAAFSQGKSQGGKSTWAQ